MSRPIAAALLPLRAAMYAGGWITGKLVVSAIHASVRWRS